MSILEEIKSPAKISRSQHLREIKAKEKSREEIKSREQSPIPMSRILEEIKKKADLIKMKADNLAITENVRQVPVNVRQVPPCPLLCSNRLMTDRLTKRKLDLLGKYLNSQTLIFSAGRSG